jgi:uncharacterized SAM-binding protein YcdF (DUF218 family)
MPRRQAAPDFPIPSTPRRRRIAVRTLLLVLLALTLLLSVPPLREPMLRALGNGLVAQDEPAPVDVIVVAPHSGVAGVLEAADLAAAGYSGRVAVFDVPLAPDELELARRGLHGEDIGSQQARLLGLLGVREVMRIPQKEAGTHGESAALQAWLRERRYRMAMVVTSTDHSRRTRRMLARDLGGQEARVLVRAARHSDFDPQRWWHTRDGVRIAVIELQKLALDVLAHPFGF